MAPRYIQWLNYVFDHPVTNPAWHWDLNAPGWSREVPNPIPDDKWNIHNKQYQVEIVELLALTFQRAGTDLLTFSDAQVNQGLWYLEGINGYMDLVTDREHEYQVPLPLRLAVIDSVYDLYASCFRTRCTETLSHFDEPASPLNSICYMFWDDSGLHYLESVRDRAQIEEAIFCVLERILTLPHRACREGALHGLGHLEMDYPVRVVSLIDTFLQQTPLDDDLHRYALQARTGIIQ